MLRKHFHIVNRFLPKKYTSFALSKALYKNSAWEAALNRVPKEREKSKLLLLNLNFMTLQRDKSKLDSFYLDNHIDILKSLGKLRQDFLIDFVKYIAANGSLGYEDLCLIKESATRKNQVVIDCLLYVIFNKQYTNKYRTSQDLDFYRLFVKVYTRLGKPNLNNISGNLFVDNWLGFCDDIIGCIDNKNDSKIIIDYIISNPKSDVADRFCESNEINNIYKYNPELRKNTLQILWNNCEFDKFVTLYTEDTEDTGDISRVRYNELSKNYRDTILFIEQLIKNKDKSIKHYAVYGFWAYLSVSPNKVNNYIRKLDKIDACVPSFNVYKKLFLGKTIEAENERTKLVNSLQYFISKNISDNCPNLNDFKNNKVLVIAESGVADEVRWSRIYQKINFSNVSIVCDPRLKHLFTNTYKNIKFIPHKRLFRGNGTSILDYHLNNLPDSIENIKHEFDFVISSGSLFKVLGASVTKTDLESYLVTKIDRRQTLANEDLNKVKVGIMWSSSLGVPGRVVRYALLQQEIEAFISMLPEVEFHSLQAPLSDDDKEFCKKNNIYINDKIDLYNDFDSSSEYFKELDFVVGPSSLNTELSAAVGPRFLHICNAPELTSMRTGMLTKFSHRDQLSSNTITIFPSQGFHCRSRLDINLDCLRNAAEYINSNQRQIYKTVE